MQKNIALYLKKVAFYEQKLQTLKQTLFSNNINNIRRAYALITNSVIDKVQLLDFFVQNIQPIGYKDIALLLWIIGDSEKFTVNYLQFEKYICHLLNPQKIKPIMYDDANLTTQLIRLFQYQVKISTELKEDRLSLIGSQNFNITNLFDELSYDEKLRWDRFDQFMKNNLVKFTQIDFEYLVFSNFNNNSVDFNTFQRNLFFQDYEKKPQQIPNFVPDEENQPNIRQIKQAQKESLY
ncbi:hypothetical protein pb186bvf_013073 [Paramecium bursaria]